MLIAPQPWELVNKVQLALIGNRLRAFQRFIDEPCTLPLSAPKGGTKCDFAVFASNIQLLSSRKKSATKCLCLETSSDKVVATSFLYLTVHRWIVGDVAIYLKFALKWLTHTENADFDRLRVIVPQPWELAKKSSVITNRKSTMRFPSSHSWTLCVTTKSPKGWLKTRIFTFDIAFHIFVAGNRRHFKFGMCVEHSKSQPIDDIMTNRPWNGRGHVTWPILNF